MEYTIQSEIGNICFNTRGQGFPIVFLHGFGSTKHVWDNVYLPEYEVICIDLPGSGGTDFDDDGNIFTMAKVVDFVITFLQIKRFAIVGHSMGGYVALAVLEKYSSKVCGICLLHTTPLPDSEFKKQKRLQMIKLIQEKGPSRFLSSFIPQLFPESKKETYEFVINQAIQTGSNLNASGLKWQLIAMMNRPDFSPMLFKCNLPVFWVIGKEDTILPYEQCLELSNQLINAVIFNLNNVGHMLHLEKPETFLEICRSFINFAHKLN